MVPGAEPFPGAVDTSTAEQNSALPRGADRQQDPVGTDLHMLASTAAHHDFGQVVLLLVPTLHTLCVMTASKGPYSHGIASIVQHVIVAWLQATCNESSLLNHNHCPAGSCAVHVLYCHGSDHMVTISDAAVGLPGPFQSALLLI